MALIPGGTFQMGSTDSEKDEQPVHAVTVASFCLDKTEVTGAAYAECAKAGECVPAPTSADWPNGDRSDFVLWSRECVGENPEKAAHPVNCVDHNHATAFCKWAGKRLPTEEEWEYAAAGGSEQRRFPWGESPPTAKRLNACDEDCSTVGRRLNQNWKSLIPNSDGHAGPAPVGSFPDGASRWGVLDLAGNVWEWTSSAYTADYTRPPMQGYRVRRGGSWINDSDASVRASTRAGVPARFRSDIQGFRCASAAP